MKNLSNQLKILNATIKDAEILSDLIGTSYRDVAKRFNLTTDNCPKHPSNCNRDWILFDFDRGVQYYILKDNKTPVGCVAMEKADDKTIYMERLSILPQFRHRGLGKKLVQFNIKKAEEVKVTRVGIGIIEEQEDLKTWYESLNFIPIGTKKFDHLPFTVGFMEFSVQT